MRVSPCVSYTFFYYHCHFLSLYTLKYVLEWTWTNYSARFPPGYHYKFFPCFTRHLAASNVAYLCVVRDMKFNCVASCSSCMYPVARTQAYALSRKWCQCKMHVCTVVAPETLYQNQLVITACFGIAKTVWTMYINRRVSLITVITSVAYERTTLNAILKLQYLYMQFRVLPCVHNTCVQLTAESPLALCMIILHLYVSGRQCRATMRVSLYLYQCV